MASGWLLNSCSLYVHILPIESNEFWHGRGDIGRGVVARVAHLYALFVGQAGRHEERPRVHLPE